MNIKVDTQQVTLQDSAYYKVRLTTGKERIIPIGFDISSIKINLPPEIVQMIY